MNFETYHENNHRQSFRLIDETGKILLSGEGYKQPGAVLNGIESVKKNLPLTSAIEKKEAKNGLFFFNIKSTGGKVVGTSALFYTPELRNRGLREMQKNGPGARVIKTTI